MPPPDDDMRLRHMLRHAREAVEMSRGCTRADLDTDRKLNLALVRLLEIIGEAASRVSEERRAAMTGIEWRGIRGLRNRIVHNYNNVDLDIVWAIVSDDLPPLIESLEADLGPD